MIRRCLPIAILLFLIPVVAGGCWDRQEIDNRTSIIALGFDAPLSGDPLRVTVQIPLLQQLSQGSGKPSGNGGPTAPIAVLSTGGSTIEASLVHLQDRLNKQLFFGHATIIVIGRELARRGLAPVIDSLRRSPKIPRNAFVLVADGEAMQVLQAKPKLERLPATFMFDMLQNRTRNSRAPIVQLGQMMNDLDTSGIDLILPVIHAAAGEDLKISGTALFQADRLVGTLGPAETRGLLWLRDQVQSRTPITVSLGNEQFLTYLALRTTSDLKPEQAGQDIRMHVQVKAEGNIVDYTPDLILDPSRISAVEKKLAEEIRNDVLAAWKKTVSLRADTGGFGVHVHRYYPRLWRGLKPTWRSQGFPSVQLSVEADVTVLRTGIVEPVHKRGAP